MNGSGRDGGEVSIGAAAGFRFSEHRDRGYDPSMRLDDVTFDEARIAEICRRNGIAKPSPIGSILTERFGPEGDIDGLVEFAANERVRLFIGRMTGDQSDLPGRYADLRTAGDL